MTRLIQCDQWHTSDAYRRPRSTYCCNCSDLHCESLQEVSATPPLECTFHKKLPGPGPMHTLCHFQAHLDIMVIISHAYTKDQRMLIPTPYMYKMCTGPPLSHCMPAEGPTNASDPQLPAKASICKCKDPAAHPSRALQNLSINT